MLYSTYFKPHFHILKKKQTIFHQWKNVSVALLHLFVDCIQIFFKNEQYTPNNHSTKSNSQLHFFLENYFRFLQFSRRLCTVPVFIYLQRAYRTWKKKDKMTIFQTRLKKFFNWLDTSDLIRYQKNIIRLRWYDKIVVWGAMNKKT